jgi:bla regulator protein BlaR1
MPALFVFLLKVNVALLFFCAGYYMALRHLTFYTLNRIYLVTAILFASIYPQINLSGFVQQHQQIAKPVQAVAFNWQAPAETFIGPLSQPNYWFWVEVVFLTGAALLALRLLMQLYSLYNLYRNSTASKIYDHDVRVIAGETGPFSFWKCIYVNPANHEQADLKAILLHEQVHVSEWHTLDILLAELSTIFYWFNPGIWLIKKAIRENIEFITDRKILGKGLDTKAYQYSLVNVSFSAKSSTIVNHFNISTIKKRIIMMNAKRSSKVNLTRYAFLVPAVVVLLLVFSISKAALVKKSANAYKALSVTIKASNAAIGKGITAITKNTAVAPHVTLSSRAKVNSAKAADTLKKEGFFLSTNHLTDSLNYVINGVKATKAVFMALDPHDIYSIEMMEPEQASKIVDKIDKKYSVLFVTTEKSAAGKKFKEKIDKLNSIDRVNDNIITIGKRANGQGASSAVTITGDASSGEGTSTGVGYTATGSSSSDVVFTTVNPKNKKPTKIKLRQKEGATYVVADSLIASTNDPLVWQIDGKDTIKGYSYTPSKTYNLSPKNKMLTIKPQIATKTYYRYNRAGSAKTYTFLRSNFDNEANIEHLSSKMIMIDGKEATESDLKKLSAADIESMSVKSGEEVTEKYGDKAKNGIVFISTKKGQK